MRTKSSAIILILPTALKMVSNKDIPGPTYHLNDTKQIIV